MYKAWAYMITSRHHTVNQEGKSPTWTHHVQEDEISVREGITVSMPAEIGDVLIVV